MTGTANYKPSDDEKTLIEKWTKRFKRAERFRQPYEDKFLRMWKLYRAYRDKQNYAYKTNIMPPIGFEIVETIKPRLSGAKMRTRIFPMEENDIKNGAIEEWDNLINYNFDVMELDEKKVDWIDAMLKYANGYAHLYWEDAEDGGDPGMDIVDNWLLYFDPSAGPRLKDSDWEIKQIFKSKASIEKAEKGRGKRTETDNEGNETEVHGVYKNLEHVTDKKIADDPRSERIEIETLKMGQIDSGYRASDDTQKSNSDPHAETKQVELWECYDHITDEIITIANREVLIRQEENPYKDINEGRLFVDLPCIRVPWSAYSMGIMEPVETIIHEIADSRNQAMDSIVFNLDPIRKVRKDAGITADDIPNGPGAVWELAKADDVVVEKFATVDGSWIEKDNLLRREIQTSLALSEYVGGRPTSAQEPSSKVEILLQQTSIRFSQMVRQMETALADVVNILIQMNQKFLTEDKAYRLLGEDVEFKKFTNESKQVKVDARVEIEPKPEMGPEARKKEVLELYKIFVADDQPDPQDAEALKVWQEKKRQMQKMVLEEYDKSQYEEVLMGLESKEEVDQDKQLAGDETVEAVTPLEPLQPIAPLEAPPTPTASPPQGLLQRLLSRLRG